MKPRTRSVVISLVAVCGGLSCASPPTGGPAAPVGAGTRTDDVLLIPPLPMPHTARLPEQGGEPGLDFRLGPSPVTAAPALSSSGPPTPLTPAGTGRLLARLPALPADRAEPFRFPTASPPAPRAGAVVVAAFPADTARSRPRPEPAEAGPLRVLRIVPSGGTELVPHVTVTFSEPMVPLTGTGAADAMRPPVELTPQPAGRWTWIDTRTARFVPDGRLPMATHFTVVVPAGTRSLSGGVLSEAVRTEFETPAARAIGGYPALDPDVLARRGPRGRPPWLRQEAAGSARLDPVMLVVFDQRIDGAALLAATRLLADGRLHPVRLASAAELAADTVASALAAVAREGYWAAFVPAGPLPRDADIRLVFEAGTRSAEGSRSTAAAQEMRFRTYGPLRLIGSDCWGGSDCRPGQPWSLRFSNPIDTAAWSDRLIRVEPALRDMSIQVHGGEVRITGSGRPNTRHTVLLDPAIRDVFGQRLGERRTATFAVGAAHPVVMLPGSPMIVLDPAGPPAVMVRSLGVRVLHVRVARVRSRDWPAYQHAVARWSSGETPAMSPPGEIVVSMSVPVAGGDGYAETAVDVGAALSQGLGHAIVVVEAAEPAPAGRRRQAAVAWVQATRLGLSASVDQGGVQTWVTSLEDGRPLADVAVTLLPSGNAGRTDAQGLAELGVGVEDHTLVAERGADSAVLPGDVHWHGGSWRMPVQDELRWYLFTDRGLYQPGETARLKGWIRHVPAARSPQLALPTGVRSVGFTVRGPRGEDVGRGEAGVGGLGGFDFAMELPEALNLGYAHVELAARGTSAEPRSVSHPLQVQEFRRPEYEVAVQADPGPHVVGAAVDVTVRAAYFGGGGLRDAGVLWRVHSRPGFFTPPGWTGWHFGRPQWSVFAQPPTAGMKTFAAETDARGMHVLRIDLGAAEPPFTTVLDAAAQVQDLTRQVGSGSVDLLVHPAAVHVGVRVGRSWVRPGEPMGVGLIVVDHDGRIMAERPIEVTLQRVAWTFGRGMPREETLDVQPVCVLASAGEPVSCTATPDAPGMYRVRADVTDAAGRVSRTEQTLWVSGGVGMWRPDRPPGQVDLVPDRDEYQPGDTARVLVQPPFHPAEALLTLRQSGIIRTARFRIDAPTYELLVPIEETHVPGLNVHVALVEREDGTAGSSGEVRLAVPPHRRELDVRVAPRSTVLEPGAETTIDVHVVDAAGRAVAGADVALWLVDEAILGLGGYRVPDPLEAFYPVASPRVQDLAARDWVIRWPRSAGPGTLSGTLLDGSESGQPIPGAEVRVEGTDAAAVTTYDGAFTLRGLAPGDYVLRVLLPDGVSLRRAVSVPAEGTHLGALIVGAEGVLVGTRDAAARALAPREMEMQELSVAQAVAPPPAPPPPPGVAGAPAADGAVQVRTDFAPLALFEPSLRTGPDGRVQVRARMPGSLTRYRVMAVAVSGTDRFGRGEASITARRELMVRLSAPRFLNHGDRFDLPVLVQNGTDADIDVEVAVRAAGLHIHDDAGQRTRISAGSRAELRFEASAVHAGTVHIQAIAASGALSDATAVDLPVYTPATTEAFAVHGYLDTDAPLVLPLAAPRDVIPQFGGLDVSVTSTALHALSDAVLYLWATRYEGAEQIASRVLAVAALRDVLAAFAAQGLPEPDVVTASTQRDIAALVSLQTPDGGWGFWRRDERPHPYVSAHAAHALQRARDRGFDVSPAALQRAVEHLQRIDRHIQDWPQSPRRTMSAYALYVRHRLGDGSAVTQARQLAATRPDRVDGELTVEAMAWLLYVLADDPASRSEAAELLRRIANRVVETAGSATFAERYTDGEHLLLHSRRRTDAVALEALIAAQPDHDLIPRIAQSLLAHRVAGHWSGTQENSWVLLALDRYFRTYEAVTPDFRSDVWIGERYAAGHEFRGRSTERVHVPIPMAELADETEVVLSREGAGRMYYRAGLRYAPTDPRIEAEARGFTVSRRYEAVDDAADVQQQPDGSWHVRAGARVRVLVSLIAPSTRFHVALLDPLPAGFEPVNPELRGTGFGDESRVDAAPVRGPGLPRPWWFTHQNLRDDRAEVFATLLGAGSYEYSYLARATTPGTFVVPPARAEMMYEPETFGRGAGDRVVVTMPEPDRR